MAYNFKNALVRTPSKSISNAISSIGKKPNFEKVIAEHNDYKMHLERSDINVITLNALEDYPDSVFVEDPAITFNNFCIILRPGAPSRFGEQKVFRNEAINLFEEVFEIDNGKIEGGDILRINDRFIIGLSDRTNKEGANELEKILSHLGAKVTITNTPNGVLHFKSDCSLLDDETILQTKKMSLTGFFENQFKVINVPEGEEIVANSLRVNNYLLVPKGFEKTYELLSKSYKIILAKVDEISKVDAGLSCMSLRW
tara:strand:+ start:73 stop:840 length:768 start_codon:yes stop_codon:yes gene_type:complete